MQAPHKISVSLGLNVLTDWLPEKGGKFYSLAKSFSKNGTPQEGGTNWLSDTPGTDQNLKIKRAKAKAENPTSVTTTNVKDNTPPITDIVQQNNNSESEDNSFPR